MRALSIPCNPNQPLATIEIDGIETLAVLLKGKPEPIDIPAVPELRGYRNGDADVLRGITVNLRASRLFEMLEALGGYLAGDVIVLGQSVIGADQDCPPSAAATLRAPVALGDPERLPCHLRQARLRWITKDNGAGRVSGAILTIRYRPGERSHRTGRRITANHFAAQLRWCSQEPAPPFAPGTVTGELHGDGLSVVRETVPRYTRRGLDAFTELAAARVRALAAAGDDRVAPYFT